MSGLRVERLTEHTFQVHRFAARLFIAVAKLKRGSTMNYIDQRDPGDENDFTLACDTCGSTEKPLSVNSMSNEFRPGEVSCGKCIFDRGNAAARRLAGLDR